MRSLLFLLLLSMTTGSQLKINGCQGGSVIIPQEVIIPQDNNRSSTDRFRKEDGKVKIVRLEKGDSETFGLTDIELKVKDDCKRPITLCPGQGEEVSVQCDKPYEFNTFKSFLCKAQEEFQCNEISTKIKIQTNKDYGIYWCGFNLSSHIVLIQKVWIQNVPVVNETAKVGGNLTFKCNYSGSSRNQRICRGHLHHCQHMLNTTHKQNTRYSMKDATETQILTITIQNLEASDQGLYYCYTESLDGTLNIHSKLNLIIVTVPQRLPLLVSIVMYIAGVLMVMLVILAIWKCISSRNPRDGHKQEEMNIYEEIQERPLEPDPFSSCYVTATYPSTALHYSTIVFKNNLDEHCVVGSPQGPPQEYHVLKGIPREPSPSGPATRSSSSLSEEQFANLSQQD